MDLSDEHQFKRKKKEEKLLQIWQSIAVLFRTSPYVVTRQLYFAKKYFILGQHTGKYFNYGHRLTGDKTDKKSTTLSMFNNGSVDSRTSLQAQFSLWLSIYK